MPVLEELPVEEKVRRGNVLLKTRPRDVEETLLQLINDDDQVVAAAAIDTARAAQDLGARRRHRARAGAPRRARLVRLRGRVVGAGRAADAGGAAARAVARAAAGRGAGDPAARAAAVRFGQHRRAVPHRLGRTPGAPRPGQRAAEEGAVPETIHFLLDGRVVATEPRRRRRASIAAPAALGFTEALGGCRCPRRCARTAWRSRW